MLRSLSATLVAAVLFVLPPLDAAGENVFTLDRALAPALIRRALP
jgi:hypothetical protein